MKHKYDRIQNKDLSLIFNKTIKALRKVVIGQDVQLDLFLSCLLVGEHVALVGESGVGKTHMIKKFIEFFNLDRDFESITGHPEVMPQDFSVKHFMQNNDIRTKRIALQKAKIFFVDEYNRISPKSLNILLDPLNDGTLHDEISDRRIKLGLNLSATSRSISIMDDDIVEERRHAFEDVRQNIKEKTSADDHGKVLIDFVEGLHAEYQRRLAEVSALLVQKKEELGAILKDGVFKSEVADLRGKCYALPSKEDKDKKKAFFDESIKAYTLDIVLKANDGSYSTVKEKVQEIEETQKQQEDFSYKEWAAKHINTVCKSYPHNLEALTRNLLLRKAESLEGEFEKSGPNTDVTKIVRNPEDDEYFFICILASNPTSRGGNFPPPDALLDRLGMEIRFDPLDAEKKADIPDQSKVVQLLKDERKRFQKDFAAAEFAKEVDFFDQNTRLFHFLHHVKNRLGLCQAEDEEILRGWCKDFLGSLVPPKQFIFEYLSRELKDYYIDEVNRAPDHAALHQFAWQWATDVESELIEVAQSKIDSGRIMNVFRKFDLKKKILDSFSTHVMVIDKLDKEPSSSVDSSFRKWGDSDEVHTCSSEGQLPVVIHARRPTNLTLEGEKEIQETIRKALAELGVPQAEVKKQASAYSHSAGVWKKLSGISQKNKRLKTFVTDKQYPKPIQKNIESMLLELSKKLAADLEHISTIVVGTSGRMVNSLERLIKSFAFIDTGHNIDGESLGDKDIDLIPSFRDNSDYYRRVFLKIGYAATCHRIRFVFGTQRSKKWEAINFAVNKAFPEYKKS
jgi:MoxR-like ATPase